MPRISERINSRPSRIPHGHPFLLQSYSESTTKQSQICPSRVSEICTRSWSIKNRLDLCSLYVSKKGRFIIIAIQLNSLNPGQNGRSNICFPRDTTDLIGTHQGLDYSARWGACNLTKLLSSCCHSTKRCKNAREPTNHYAPTA